MVAVIVEGAIANFGIIVHRYRPSSDVGRVSMVLQRNDVGVWLRLPGCGGVERRRGSWGVYKVATSGFTV